MARLDFNKAPYFDDFDSSKNYMRVLFRSGVPVQARELNTLQTSLQNQIERFANHIFKNGSRVSNGSCALSAKSYVRLRPFVLGTSELVDVEQFPEGTKIVGDYSGITATLVKGVNATGPEGALGVDPATIYVVYNGTAIDGKTSTFVWGEPLKFLDENDQVIYEVEIRCPTCTGSTETDTISPTGKGMIFTVDEGVFYYEGMFIECARQDLLVHKYLVKDEMNVLSTSAKMTDNTVAPIPCKIGLDLVQTVVTFQEDASLLDPSLGYPNSTAPGAHRYKVELRLTKRSYDSVDGENFILLCRIGEQMLIEYMKTDSEYSDIMDMIAKRTYETNGNYTVRPFKVSFYESHKKGPSDARGWSETGDPNKVVALVSPSVGYVKGYRVETISDTPVQIPKARETSESTGTKQVPGFIKQFPERTYIVLEPTTSRIWPNDDADPNMVGFRKLTFYNNLDILGTCYVNDMRLHAPAKTGTGAHGARYRYYIYGLKMVAGKKLSDADRVGTDSSFSALPIKDPVSNRFDVYNANQSALVFPVNRENVKSLRDIDDSSKGSIAITVRRKLKGHLDSNESITFSASTNQSYLPASARTIIWVGDGGTTKVYDASAPGVMTTDGTSMTITCAGTGGSSNSGKQVTVLADVLMTAQKEKAKQLAADTHETSVAPSGVKGDVIELPRADVQSFKALLLKNGQTIDVSDEYMLDQGYTDQAYRASSIVRTKDSSILIESPDRLRVTFEYFNHSGSQGWFTVDSYPINAPDNPIAYEDLPVFELSTKQSISAANAFDFRPMVLNETSPVSALLPAGETTAIFDIEYYLGRTDLLQIDKDGKLYIKLGTPSETPRPPKPDDNAMALYEIWLKPYTYSLDDISTKFIENKRYTMRDIGRLEKRIENVEYYTVLNLLEKSAADMSIKDENGLDRFKNGFIADNFADFQAADLLSPEFRAAVDRGFRELRPQFRTRNKRLTLDLENSSSNIHWHGKVGMLKYVPVEVDSNPYATKHISINPYYQYNKRGTLVLSPNNDVWSDETRLPTVVTDIDTGVAEFTRLARAAGVLGTDWGSWIDQNRTILGSTTSTSTQVRHLTTGVNNVTTTSNVTTTTTSTGVSQIRHGVTTTVESRTQEYTIEDIVKDVQIIPYMREMDIDFYAQKLKPNTQVYAFFDGVPVSEFCRSINFVLTDNSPEAKAMIEYGSALLTDANGELIGTFRIPEGRFFVGEKRFKLSDDPSGNSDPDIESTSCENSFFAGGLDVTRQDSTLNIITPMFNTEEVSETREIVETSQTRETEVIDVEVTPVPPPPKPPECTTIQCYCAKNPTHWQCSDPIAQSFITSREMFVTGLDLYFKHFDPINDKFFVELRTMDNGYPTTIVLGRKDLTIADVEMIADAANGPGSPITSDDSSVPVKVTFDIPVYLEADTQYCFVVGGFSPNTRIWVSRLGEEVVNMPGKIVEVPPTGQSSFRSLNGITWNAEQFEAIKFIMYAAEFTPGQMEVAFNLKDADQINEWPLEENPLETQLGSNLVRVYARDHGFSENDTVRLSLFDKQKLTFEAATLPPQIGQNLVSGANKAVIHDIKKVEGSVNKYEITVKNTTGDFVADNSGRVSVTSPAITKKARDTSILKKRNSKAPETGWSLNQADGVLIAPKNKSAYPQTTLAGIPVTELNKSHSIVKVDSQDSFIIQVSSSADMSGRVGGTTVTAYQFNEKYDLFNVSGAYLNYRSTDKWSLEGIGYARAGSPFEGTDGEKMDPVNFVIGQDTYLGRPHKIESADPNSLVVKALFDSVSPYTSPVINADTFSVVTVSNRTEWISEDDFNTAPNAADRFVAEDDPVMTMQGTETYKYVTKNVLLAEPANDLNIFFDVYRDIHADFDVYVKRLNVYEEKSIDDIPWMKVTGLQKNKFSADLTDRIEYHIVASKDIDGWLDADGDPEPFVGFKVKLVGRARNSCKPVTFQSLRAIAVT